LRRDVSPASLAVQLRTKHGLGRALDIAAKRAARAHRFNPGTDAARYYDLVVDELRKLALAQ
jgi:hypothetical protein